MLADSIVPDRAGQVKRVVGATALRRETLSVSAIKTCYTGSMDIMESDPPEPSVPLPDPEEMRLILIAIAHAKKMASRGIISTYFVGETFCCRTDGKEVVLGNPE